MLQKVAIAIETLIGYEHRVGFRSEQCNSYGCLDIFMRLYIEGILPKMPYPPCLRMADRALLAGYPRYKYI